MDLPPLVDALILGIVEGITEFLPVSSTGHLIVVSDFLGANDEKGKVFDIVIQLGAILAVCWEFRVRIGQAFAGLRRDPVQQRFAANLFFAFLPAAVVGLALQTQIKKYLFNPTSVAAALIVGALVIFAVERWYARKGAPRVASVYDMTWRDALKRDDHGRDALRAVARGRHRVLVLPRDPGDVCRERLPNGQIPRAPLGRRPCEHRGRLRRELRVRASRGKGAHPLRRAPRLPRLRVVPDRVGSVGALVFQVIG